MQEVKLTTEYLRDRSVEELRKKEKEIRKKLFEIREQETCRKGLHIGKPHIVKSAKRDIARVLTIIREKEFK